jgi:hypothetical protein
MSNAIRVATSYRSPSPIGARTLNTRAFITIAFAATTDPITAATKVAAPSSRGHHREQVSSGR